MKNCLFILFIIKGQARNAAEYKVLQTFFNNLGQNLWVGAYATQTGTPFQWISDGSSLSASPPSPWWCSGL